MKLYIDILAPNARRVLMFVAEKDVAVPTIELDIAQGEHRSPAMLRLNPFGRLPILELDDGTALAESTTICRHLEALHPEPALFGASAAERAVIDMWHRRAEHELFVPAVEYGHHTQPGFSNDFDQIAEWGEACRRRILASSELFDSRLGAHGHVAGESFSAADITAFAGVEVATLWGLQLRDAYPSLARWYERISARPSARVMRYAS